MVGFGGDEDGWYLQQSQWLLSASYLLAFVLLDASSLSTGRGGTWWLWWWVVVVVTPLGGQWSHRWESLSSGDRGGDKGPVIIGAWGPGCLVNVVWTLVGVVGPWPVSALLEPPRDGPVVLKCIIQVHSYLCFYQPVVDSLLGVIPLGPVPTQLPVSFF